MGIYLTKLLTVFVLPLGLGVLLGTVALLLLFLGWPMVAAVALLVQLLVLWACSTPWFHHQLLTRLEAEYPRVALEDTPVADVAVVLGGALGALGDPPSENLTGSSDRVLRAARLYRVGKVRHVLAVGGNLIWLGQGRPECELTRDLLVEWGVPDSAILTECRSRNTRENALHAAAIIREQGWHRVLLVTSATHMRRAVSDFSEAGIEVMPSATDYYTTGPLPLDVLDFLPDAEALSGVSAGLRELLGRGYQRLRG